MQRNVKHGFIIRHLLTGRVRVIAEQREEETLVLIGEVMHFEFFQKLMHGLFAGEDGRNHNKSARIFGNAFRGLDAWQHSRMKEARYVPVQNAQRQIAGGNQHDERARQSRERRCAVMIGVVNERKRN